MIKLAAFIFSLERFCHFNASAHPYTNLQGHHCCMLSFALPKLIVIANTKKPEMKVMFGYVYV